MDKEAIIIAVNASVKKLQQGIEGHCRLVAAVLEEHADDQSLKPLMDLCPKRSREIRLEKAIKETIDVLEETRKAFKSKRLAELRKKLTHVLIDTE